MRATGKFPFLLRYIAQTAKINYDFYLNTFVRNPLYIVPMLFLFLAHIFHCIGYWVLILITALSIGMIVYKRRNAFLSVMCAVFLLAMAVICSNARSAAQLAMAKAIFNSKAVEYEIVFRNNIRMKGDKLSAFAKVNNANVYVAIPRYPEVEPGSICKFRGIVTLVSGVNGFEEYLIRKYTYLYGKGEVIACNKRMGLPGAMYRIYDWKSSFVGYLEGRMGEPYASLFVGILFGDSRVFTPEFEEVIQISGVSHVVAASGYNIQFVENISKRLLWLLKLKSKLIGVTLIVWLYVFIAGSGASVVRAGLSATVYALARLLRYPMNSHANIVLVLGLMVAYDVNIVFDIGFQLSAVATAAIVVIVPVLEYRLKLSSSILIPVVCTLVTAPILISNFGGFSILGPLASLLAMWSIEDVMYLGLFVGIMSFISPFISTILIRIGESLVWCFTEIINLVANIPVSKFDIDPLIIILLVGTTVVVAMVDFRNYVLNV